MPLFRKIMMINLTTLSTQWYTQGWHKDLGKPCISLFEILRVVEPILHLASAVELPILTCTWTDPVTSAYTAPCYVSRGVTKAVSSLAKHRSAVTLRRWAHDCGVCQSAEVGVAFYCTFVFVFPLVQPDGVTLSGREVLSEAVYWLCQFERLTNNFSIEFHEWVVHY